MNLALVVLVAVPLLAPLPLVHGQSPDGDGAPVFEVASVKPNESDDGRVMFGLQPGGRFTASNVTFVALLRQAYQLQEFQVAGGPGWIRSDRFDVTARAPEGDAADIGPQADRIRPMLQALLRDRFKLATHNETRDMPIYALVVARSDGTLGPKLTPSATDCAAQRGRGRGPRGGGAPPQTFQPGQRIDCGLMMGFGVMNAGGMPIIELARTISPQVGRIVIDKTGLTGSYDFELNYAPDPGGGGFAGIPAPPGAQAPAADPNLPSLFTALEEQLGLKLDAERGPVDVLVIDAVEPPDPD
jgi:uncharacterized protein (TIGR03435 family)